MASTKMNFFKELKKGKYDWKVQARVLNLWRGFSSRGEPFKAFNLLLLDSQRSRIHAFVPGGVADQIEKTVEVGNIFLIENFTVKQYTMEDKFRPIKKEIQIVFGEDTMLKQLPENAVNIERSWFDFYDLADLKPLSQQTTYLADVIGVMEDYETIGKVKNKRGRIQSQFKFNITDGRTSMQVTLWDEFAELLADTLKRDLEHPVIIIIGCARVNMWQDEVILGNVGATTFYLNYNHHSVIHLRKRCSKPGFSNQILSTQKNRNRLVYKVEDIKNLDHSHMELEVLALVKITMIEEMKTWCHPVCTSCYQKTDQIGNTHTCNACNRVVPYAYMRFEIYTKASDETGEIEIVLEDREVRTLIGKSVCELMNEGNNIVYWPHILKTIISKECTVKIIITEANIQKKQLFYLATDIMEGFNIEACKGMVHHSYPHPISETEPQASGSSCHISNYSLFK